MNLIVVRHGQTDWNVDNLLQGSTDIALNETGAKQALETSKELSNIDFDVIFSSPLKRALDTANSINAGRHLPIIKDSRLIEREFGEYEGQPGKNVDFKKYWDYTANIQDCKVEPIQNFFSRVTDFLNEIISKYGNTEKNILVVTHNGVNLAIDSILNGMPNNIFTLNLAPCKYKIFENPTLEKEKIKFSIIIPAYNVEQYIKTTLESIFNQTYKNYEIIVVDDCSVDNTYSILKEYNNIRLFKTPQNLRQGGARNLGLDACRGEYIVFLDSDDTLYDDFALENLNKCIELENNPDIIYTGMKFSGKRDMIIMPTDDNCKKEYRLSEYKWANVVSICWKNSLLQKNNIRFPEGIRYEDVYFYFLGIEKSKTYSIGNFILYDYNNRDSSTTTSYTLDQSIDTIKIIGKLANLKTIIDKENIPLLKKRIEQQCSRIPVRLDRAINKLLNDSTQN
ncbi:MAG: histidine phosphatase family protein [Clostridia bacterium]|nr:histidine phosphatase family protein [Clostridia bacterium]